MSDLPIRDIPGDYGLPFLGPIKDRRDYFYGHGRDPADFFKARMQKHNSTVFRCNMPPGPFISRDPRVVCLLDAVSFQTLFDTSLIEKKDVLDGTFMPTTKFTGGYRACAYLDPSEPKHSLLKGFFLSVLSRKHDVFLPLFRSSVDRMFSNLEHELGGKGEASFNDLSDAASFEFVFRFLCDKDPSEVEHLGAKGGKKFDLWLLCQLAPLMSLGLKFLPNFLEDLLLHTFPLPFLIVKSDYQKLYDAFHESATSLLNEAEKVGINRDEACHNLVFLAGFNAYGGMKALFPVIMKWITAAGEPLHRRLRDEIRGVVDKHGVTLAAINEMPLTKSVVYEALRIDPPVPFQYGKAKVDFKLRNHEASFLIKKGEMLFGFQPLATADPKVFDRAEEFVADRFVGDGEKLLKYVYWSNGRETEEPMAVNKQCPAKHLVVSLCRLMLVEFFLRYDTFTAETGRIMLGASVKIKSLTKSAVP